MFEYDITDIVEKIIGPIEPIRSSNEDYERLKNQENMIILFEEITDKLINNAKYKDDYANSSCKIGEAAYEALQEMKEKLEQI